MTPQTSKQQNLSCSSCKDRKRKCDRGLPKCSLCSRRNLICDYPTRRRREASRPQPHAQSQTYPSPQASTPASTSVSQIPGATAALSPPNSEFPPVFYLDNAVYQNSLVPKPSPTALIPPSIISLIGDASNWSSTATVYFKTVHTWMPIVSKKRFFENVPIDDTARSPLCSDYALLILCMELSMWMPREQDPRTKAYLAAKSFYLELEIQGIVSIQLLQALILLACYEMGHAIFPSAAVSIEACVRYGQALGINWELKSSKKPFAWIDREEQNRVWWAVFMLECVSRIGYPRSPPLVQSPSPEVHLPASTPAWDEGLMPVKNLTILQPRSNQDLGPFATMAEATRLLSRVLEHVAVTDVDEQHDQEALILDRALKALGSVVEYEGDYNKLSIMNQTTMCSISLIILHEAHASKHSSSVSEYFQTVHHTKHVTNSVSISREEFTRSLTDVASIHSCVREASPYLTTLLYQSAIANLRLDQETGSEDSSKALHTMKTALAQFDNRWRASGAYLRILEAREVSAM